MTEEKPIVYVVDDDPSMRRSLARLITSAGLSVETFDSAHAFLKQKHIRHPSCLVLDVKLPGINGPELQEELLAGGIDIPIVFITGHGSIHMSVNAMKKGAVDFLTKPFDDRDFFDAVHTALDKDAKAQRMREQHKGIQENLKTLTPREYEVLTYVITGMLNKQIASALNISEKTVKVHRKQVMIKMDVDSVAELVRLTEKAGVKPAEMIF